MGLDLEFYKTSRPAMEPPSLLLNGYHGLFPQWWTGQGMKLTYFFQPVPRLRMGEAIIAPLVCLHFLYRVFNVFIVLWTNNTTHYGVLCHFWSLLLPHKSFLHIRTTPLTSLINANINLTQWHITYIYSHSNWSLNYFHCLQTYTAKGTLYKLQQQWYATSTSSNGQSSIIFTYVWSYSIPSHRFFSTFHTRKCGMTK